jgi:nicotinic acid phosphoribosyltransferase
MIGFLTSTHVGSFGIGTWLTNDFKTKSSGYKEQSKALNMVIKLGSVDGKECVKISDEITKVRAALKHQDPLFCLDSPLTSWYRIPEFKKQ